MRTFKSVAICLLVAMPQLACSNAAGPRTVGTDLRADQVDAGDVSADPDLGAETRRPADTGVPDLKGDGQEPCTPQCQGKECGDDGCGGECGTCPVAAPLCKDNVCAVAGCVPDCEGKECGADGCDGECGVCPEAAPHCTNHMCAVEECFPDCEGKECGNDGCGGKCGDCPAVAPFCQGYVCTVEECEPDCADKECGDDGCGGACGFCAGDAVCQDFHCLGACDVSVVQPSNAGCSFWAVDLDNALEGDYDAQNAQFAIIVSNSPDADQAQVTVTRPDGQKLEAIVEGGGLHKFEVPSNWSLDGTMKGFSAFKIDSSRPISAYQFNPLSNIEEVFSNDASVLFPVSALGTEYRVVTLPQLGEIFRGYLTVVGAADVPVEVTVQVTAATLSGEGIPAGAPGTAFSVTLGPGEVLNVETAAAEGDLSGTLVTATGRIALFGGHEAANVTGACCADHLEQQLPSTDRWGKQFLVAKSWPRWKEKDHVKIVAHESGTTIQLNPAVASVPTLNAGQHYTFQVDQDVEITAAKPVLVAHFLASSHEIFGLDDPDKFTNCFTDADCPEEYTCDPFAAYCMGPNCNTATDCPPGHACQEYSDPGYPGNYCDPVGDPTMMLVPPVQQYLDSYVFLVPDAYLEDYMGVVAPLDAQMVALDGESLDMAQFEPIGVSEFGAYREPVDDGPHTIWSDKGIGVMVYGYDNDVSYGYPAGMKLDKF